MTEYMPTIEQVRYRYWSYGSPVPEFLQGTAEYVAGADFDRWLAEHDRQVAERAWAEGYRQGWGDRDEDFHAFYVPSGFEQDTLNPYRKEATGD